MSFAQVGDELASIDPAPGEAHNYFAVMELPPQELLLRLVNQHGCHPSVLKVASLVDLDLVDTVLGACVEPVCAPAPTGELRDQSAALRGLFAMLRHPPDGKVESGRAPEPTKGAGASLERTAWGQSTDLLMAKAAELDIELKRTEGRAEIAQPLGRANASALPDEEQAESADVESSAKESLVANKTLDDLMAAELAFLHVDTRLESLYQACQQLASEAAGDVWGHCKLPILQRQAASKQPEVVEQQASQLKKSRLPGLKGDGEPKVVLTVGLLTEIAAVAPLKVAAAAIVLLLRRRDGLTGGDFSILPPNVEEPRAEGVSSASFARAGASDTELLEFALRVSDKFPILHRWIKLQLRSNPALADLQPGQGRLFPTRSATFCSLQGGALKCASC